MNYTTSDSPPKSSGGVYFVSNTVFSPKNPQLNENQTPNKFLQRPTVNKKAFDFLKLMAELK